MIDNYSLESIDCNICNSNNKVNISQKGQFNLPINVVLCKNCGLGYLSPRWDAKSYLDFYKNEYDKYYRPSLVNNYKKSTVSENSLIKRLEINELFPNTINNVLDIGSGEGINLKDLRKKFPDANYYAIEPSIESQINLKNEGFSILSDDANSDWEKKATKKFSIIILRHVLEHFLDPLSILQKIHVVLEEEGILYIAVPNNLNPIQSLTKTWFRVVHTYYFNKYSLNNILAKSGFKITLLREGDRFNKGEVFLVAKKCNHSVKSPISQEHYLEQKTIFENHLEKENTVGYKIIELFKKIRRKLK